MGANSGALNLGLDESLAARANAEVLSGRVKAVVLAGGRGTRLAPYTSVLPKPLMPVGERAILEVVVEQLADSGVVDITLCVGYLSHLIRAVFENGTRREGLRITYAHEAIPLGTAGPLRLIEGLDHTFLSMNGDVLTTLDYSDLVRHHIVNENVLTIATHRRTTRIDYGVLSSEKTANGDRVVEYREKPEFPMTVSMGIYVIEPAALQYIPANEHFDFPDLVHALLADGAPVGSYEYDGLWFDIGRREDYEQAVAVWDAHTSPLRAADAVLPPGS